MAKKTCLVLSGLMLAMAMLVGCRPSADLENQVELRFEDPSVLTVMSDSQRKTIPLSIVNHGKRPIRLVGANGC